jgi:hypothetical protein
MINANELAKAIKLLKEGKLIVFPTETVYALAGDARNLLAIQQIFALKKRPTNQPLSVLLAKEHPLGRWARNIPPVAEKLAQHFWPGPLTLILQKEKSVLTALTSGQDKIGLRVPDHPIAQAILHAFGSGLAARYLKKTECFCFTQQTFNPGQQRDMPVLFHIDQHLPKNINTITLAYTLFDTSGLKHAKIALQNLGRIPL